MRILYGVTGEGMGHATRSKVILEHLVGSAAQHEIEIVVSGRAHTFLTRAFPSLGVHEVHGLTRAYEDNRVRRSRTAYELLRGIYHVGENAETMQRIWERFRPELCVSDFESLAYLCAKEHGLPVLSIDNMQVLNRCELDVEIPDDERGAFRLAKAFVKAKLPRCDHYFITTFFFPEVRKKRTSLHPPILRSAILDAKRDVERRDHVLVYQTSDTFSALVPSLRQLPGRFVVYGFKRNEELGNVTLKDFSEQGFVDDLKRCRAVIAGGGYSLMGEAVFLGKPMYSVPLRGQAEQVVNALYLEKLGYGEYHRDLSVESIARFLGRADRYGDALAGYRQDGNARILAALDERIDEVRVKGRLR
jgi:uncharacterized protein (TIGR00661 family)